MTETNYSVAPGEYLREWMDENRVGVEEVSGLLRADPDYVRALLSGRVPIGEETALRLADVTGILPKAWLRYERAYRADLARLAGSRVDVTWVAPGALEKMLNSDAGPSPKLRAAIERARERNKQGEQ